MSKELIQVSVDGIPSVDLKWIGYVISWIFDLVSDIPGAIAVGVIIFTLALKTLVLPLDIYSRVKMRKQSLLMENMRPEMEKLQKQYANDKQMYNQKLMELQRANGYNPLGACLPTLVSLVIFMVVFSSFSQYSQYANLSSYNEMTKEYSSAVHYYVLTDEKDKNSDEYFLLAAVQDGLNNPVIEDNILIADEELVQNNEELNLEKGGFYLSDGNGGVALKFDEKENKEKPVKLTVLGYYIDYDKFENHFNTVKNNLPEEWHNEWGNNTLATLQTEDEKNLMVKDFVRLRARTAAADYYIANKPKTSLIWIGNVWYPDSMLNKEVPSFSNFRSTITRAAGSIDANYEESYNEVTFNLHEQKDTYNGYFVLIVLAIGFMFLQQFITMRSQKAASEFSSVDGQGARTNKMMMIMMPIIFGFFSFFYSAAFSIYMIINTLYSFISTLIINKIVSVRFDKNIETKQRQKLQGRAGRKRLK